MHVSPRPIRLPFEDRPARPSRTGLLRPVLTYVAVALLTVAGMFLLSAHQGMVPQCNEDPTACSTL